MDDADANDNNSDVERNSNSVQSWKKCLLGSGDFLCISPGRRGHEKEEIRIHRARVAQLAARPHYATSPKKWSSCLGKGSKKKLLF